MTLLQQANATLYDVFWTDVSGCSYTVSTQTLTKTAAKSWSDGGARSLNLLAAGENGYVEYIGTAADESVGNDKVIGLATYNTDPHYQSTNYGCMISEGNLYIWESGSYIGYYGKFLYGDKLNIERSGSTLYYKKNGTTLRSVTTNSLYELYGDVSIYDNGVVVTGVQANFEASFTVFNANTDADCINGTAGEIALSCLAGTSPYTYSWDHGPTTATVTGLQPGTYGVLVEDAGGTKRTLAIDLHSSTEYYDLNGCTVNGTTLRKTASGSWGTGTAVSTNNLGPGTDGAIQYTYTGYDGPKIIGLSYQDDLGDSDIKTIKYGLWITEDNVSVVASGSIVGYSFEPFVDDQFRIARDGDRIRFYRNQREFFDIETDPDRYLVADVSIRDQNSEVVDLKTTVCYGDVGISSESTNEVAGGDGTLTVTGVGGRFPYTIIWADYTPWPQGKLDTLLEDTSIFGNAAPLSAAVLNYSYRSGLDSRDYTVQVQDVNGSTESAQLKVGTGIKWVSSTGVTIDSENTITKSGSTGWGTGISTAINLFEANTDGGFWFTVDETTTSYAVGLRDPSNSQASQYSDMDWAVYISSGTLYAWDGSSLSSSLGALETGDEILVNRSGSSAKVLLNGTQVYSGTLTAAQDYKLDITVYESTAKIVKLSIKERLYRPVTSASITNASCTSPNTGAITVSASVPAGYTINSYAWTYNGSAAGNDPSISSLTPGWYTLTIDYDAPGYAGLQSVESFLVGYEVDWDTNNMTANMSATGNDLSRTSAGTTLGEAIALNRLFPLFDGAACYTIPANYAQPSGSAYNYSVVLGMTRAGIAANPAVFDYAIAFFEHIGGSQMVLAVDYPNLSGSSSPYNIIFPTLQAGDKLWILREGNQVKFAINDEPAFHSVLVDPSYELVVDASIAYGTTTMSDALASFNCEPYTEIDQLATLKRKLDGSFTLVEDGTLDFLYVEEYTRPASSTLSYRLLAADQSEVSNPPATSPTNIALGRNALSIDLDSAGLPTGFYILEVTNQKNERSYLRFKYVN